MRDLTYIVAFRKVAETKNFTAAAQELHMTTSAVSRHVSRLEDALGVQLVERSTRHVRLTNAGKDFYARCARGLAELEEAVEQALAIRGEPHGLLRIGTTPFFGKLHVLPAILAFQALYSRVTVEISLSHPDSSFLESGVDILIRAGDVRGRTVKSEALAPMRHVICAAPAYLRRHGTPKRIQNLSMHNCLVATQPKPVFEWPFTVGRKRKFVPVSGTFRADSMEAIYTAVISGVGIARLPNYVIGPELRSGKLLSLFPPSVGAKGRSAEDATTLSVMRAYYLKKTHPNPSIEAFVGFLKARFSQNYDWERRDSPVP